MESSAERPSGNSSSRHLEAGLRTAGRKDDSPGEPQDAVRPTSGNPLTEGRVRTATGQCSGIGNQQNVSEGKRSRMWLSNLVAKSVSAFGAESCEV